MSPCGNLKKDEPPSQAHELEKALKSREDVRCTEDAHGNRCGHLFTQHGPLGCGVERCTCTRVIEAVDVAASEVGEIVDAVVPIVNAPRLTKPKDDE